MQNPLPHILAILTSTPNRWLEITRQVSPELLAWVPKPGEWSAMQCLEHIIDTERGVFPARLQAFLDGQDFPAFYPDTQGSQGSAVKTPADLAAEFAQLRQVSLELFASLSETDLPRPARHAELGPVILSELLHEWAAHDLDHTIQAERALMQLFIQGCGPWQVYFKSNTIS